MWDIVKENYFESIATVLPIHRILIALFGFLCVLSIEQQNYKSIIETLLRFEFSNFSTESGKLLEHASLFDCLWGLILCISSIIIYHFSAKIIFSKISKIIKYEQRVNAHIEQYKWLLKIPDADRSRSIERAQVLKKNSLKKLRFFSVGAEFSISIFLSLMIASYWGNALDIAVAGVAFILSFAMHGSYVYFFYSTYLGPALQENLLNGVLQPVLESNQ